MVEFNSIVVIEYLSHNGLSEFMDDMDYLNSCSITFRFDIPVFLSRLHLEDRSWGFCRFDLDLEPRFYVTKGFKAINGDEDIYFWSKSIHRYDNNDKQVFIRETLWDYCQRATTLYKQLLEEGLEPSSASMILPQNQYIKYMASINLKHLRDYLRLPSRVPLEKDFKETLLQICRHRIINWRLYEPL